MQLGQYSIPDTRLFPETIQDVKTVYDSIQSGETTSLDLAKILGYTSNTTGAYYKRLSSLTGYGLIEKGAKFRVSELGKRIAYPESDYDKKLAIKDSILHIPLWAELFRKYDKNPPAENFWVQIKGITGIESPTAQKAESQIRKWYMEDVAQISDDVIKEIKGQGSEKDQTKSLSSKEDNTKSMSQQLISPDQEKLEFGGSVLLLPKKDLKKEWEKLQKYMKIYLEDYQEQSVITEVQSQEEPNPDDSQ